MTKRLVRVVMEGVDDGHDPFEPIQSTDSEYRKLTTERDSYTAAMHMVARQIARLVDPTGIPIRPCHNKPASLTKKRAVIGTRIYEIPSIPSNIQGDFLAMAKRYMRYVAKHNEIAAKIEQLNTSSPVVDDIAAQIKQATSNP